MRQKICPPIFATQSQGPIAAFFSVVLVASPVAFPGKKPGNMPIQWDPIQQTEKFENADPLADPGSSVK